MAMDPDVARRQREEVKRRRREEGLPELPSRPLPVNEVERDKDVVGTRNLVEEKMPGLSRKGVHYLAFADELRKRYAQSICGKSVSAKRHRTRDKSLVTCEACLARLKRDGHEAS